MTEKAFGNLKERLNMRRMLVSSEQSLDGKLFVEFVVSSIFRTSKSKCRKQIYSKAIRCRAPLDKLDVIECFEAPRRKLRVGELLEKQKEIYLSLGIPLPPRYE